MTNLHYIADDKLGVGPNGHVEREYAEVDREVAPKEYVIKDSEVGKALYTSFQSGYEFLHVNLIDYENEHDLWHPEDVRVLEPTGNVRIDGTVYRMVDRNAAVGEKVLAIKECVTYRFEVGDVFTVTDEWGISGGIDVKNSERDSIEMYGDEYVVLEPADELTLTEADVRNNPRQVIDLIANLAGRLSKLESRVALTDDRVSRLGTANQQAYDIVSRNVETWAQEFEEYKQSPAPWATQEQLVELTKQVAEIAGRKQSKDTIVEISEVTAKSALLIAEATELLKRTALTAEERREL